ncbi:MAG: exosome complex protein Rrp42 [Candidatus Poseidoniales archaeon]|nr:MAG: exosome complex protein Rrp42 [Candidatus Poseidoniales archaeon]
MVDLVPTLLRQELSRLADADQRLDGRSRWGSRDVTLETDCLYNAEGSAKVTIGGTIVYAGVKFELRTPWPDRPAQGSLMCGAELRPVAGRKYEPGPPSPQSIELGRVVDRGIRESGCIDMAELCIVPGEKVWGVMIDLHVLSDQGNIFDACGLAAIAALRTAVVPAERFDVGEDHTLSVNGTPIMASFTRVGGRYVLDASEEEELGGDERIHITLGDKGHLHSLQKGLKGVFTPAEFAEIFEVAQTRCVELRKLVAEQEAN